MKTNLLQFVFLVFCLFQYNVSFAQEPSEAQIKAEMMRLMQENPELLSNPEALVEQARKNLGIKDPNAVEKVKDDGITNATHGKYVDKIVFANSAISNSSPNESSFKTSFSSPADGIYARLYAKQSYKNFLAEKNAGKDLGDTEYSITYYVNGKVTGVGYGNLTAEQSNKATSFDFIIAPKSGDSKYVKSNYSPTSGFVKTISNLPAGTHKIKVEVTAGFDKTLQTMASGEFSITLSSSTKDAFVKAHLVESTYVPANSGDGEDKAEDNGYCENPKITIDNQSGKTIDVEIFGYSGRVSSQKQYSGKTTYAASKGYVIKINGEEFMTVSAEDDKETFIYKK